jgi:enoyl-CoA hydratase
LDLDASIRVIILCGAGDHFSSGHDLGTPEEVSDMESKPFGHGAIGRVNRSWHLMVENSLRWRDVRKPTIAAVQGYCIFGGYLIASCMDIIIAADDAKFLPAHLQMFTAPWDLGIRKAKQILYENRFIPAEEALQLGLACDVVPRDKLMDAAMEQAEKFAANDSLTLRMLKQSINQAQDAMGYRTAIQAAHGNYMTIELSAALAENPDRLPRQLGGVGRALEKDQ